MRAQSTVCLRFATLVALPLVASLSAAGPERAAKAPVPTFARDVAPILYKNCTTCHRQDTLVYGLFPHTDLRGKAWDYKLVRPDGTTTTILSVPPYNFNRQTYYLFKEPLQVPKGARIVSTA